MKAISLWQPWASAIACGAKKIETRSWSTAYRGRIAIHAAKMWDRDTREGVGELCHEQPALVDYLKKVGINRLSEFPLGAVVCTAELVACTPTEILRARGLSDLEESLGNYYPGRFGWVLQDIVPLNTPAPARGFQKLWEWCGS